MKLAFLSIFGTFLHFLDRIDVVRYIGLVHLIRLWTLRYFNLVDETISLVWYFDTVYYSSACDASVENAVF